MRRTSFRTLVTAIGAAALGLSLALPASAAPPTLDSATDVVVLAAAERSLSDRLGGSFGNAWLDAATGKLTVGVTDAALVGEIRAAGAVPKLVEHSAAELDSIVSRLDDSQASRPKSVTEWYVDAPTNSVVVSVLGADPVGTAWARAATAGVDAVRTQPVSQAPRPLWNLIGGDPLYLPNGGRCSIGFSARSGAIPYVLTAGHCIPSLQTTYSGVGGPIGFGAARMFPGVDWGAIWVSGSAAVPTPHVSRYASGGTVIVAGGIAAGVGAAVCRSGSTTGWRCGTIQARDATVCYPEGCVSGMIRTDACAEPGDSGGSLVTAGEAGARVQAQGLTSGGSGNCTVGGTTYFDPIGRALNAWRLTLYTG